MRVAVIGGTQFIGRRVVEHLVERGDAVVDTMALTRDDVTAVLPHLPDVPVVVLSSMDVYRIFGALLDDDRTPMAVPVDEDGPLRVGRYPYVARVCARTTTTSSTWSRRTWRVAARSCGWR